MISEQK